MGAQKGRPEACDRPLQPRRAARPRDAPHLSLPRQKPLASHVVCVVVHVARVEARRAQHQQEGVRPLAAAGARAGREGGVAVGSSREGGHACSRPA
jgi:hypothetical protein